MKKFLLTPAALALACAAALPAHAAIDRFNTFELGPQWVVDEGRMEIVERRVYSNVNDVSSIARNTDSAEDSTAFVEVRVVGTGVQFGAVVVGYQDARNNAFLKVQSQDGHGTFDRVGMYYGNNTFGHFALAPELTPYSVLWIRGSVSGTTARLSVDTDRDGEPEFVYLYGYGGRAQFGTGAGIASAGATALDNFKSNRRPQPAQERCIAPRCRVIDLDQRAESAAVDATK